MASEIDFFISYNSADIEWAEWIAWQLEEFGYTTVLQAWDFRPGENFVQEMQSATSKANKTIAVLSPTYLTSDFTQVEWQAAFAKDPTGKARTLIPVKVRPCDTEGLLPQIIFIDFVGYGEETNRERLLKGIGEGRAKPKSRPVFPGGATQSASAPKNYPHSTREDVQLEVKQAEAAGTLASKTAEFWLAVAVLDVVVNSETKQWLEQHDNESNTAKHRHLTIPDRRVLVRANSRMANADTIVATVVAVGDGILADGTRTKMQVDASQIVLVSACAGSEVEVGGETLKLVREQDILAVIE